MSPQREIKKLFLSAHSVFADKCITKAEIYKLIEKEGLFKEYDLSTRGGQTRFGIFFSSLKGQTYGGVNLSIVKQGKNNFFYSFRKPTAQGQSVDNQSTPAKAPESSALPSSGTIYTSTLVDKDDWARAFLEYYKENGNISHSCKLAMVSKSTFYLKKKQDAHFAAQVEDAYQTAIDSLVEVARKRAAEKSDVLAIFLLKNLAPERFGDRTQVQHSGAVQQNHIVFTSEAVKAIQDAQKSYQEKFGTLPSSMPILDVQPFEAPQALTLSNDDATHIAQMKQTYDEQFPRQ